LLGNDGISIDIGAIQRDHQPVAGVKLFHWLLCRFLNRLATLLNILPHPAHGITAG
jgi:hypothetical protein